MLISIKELKTGIKLDQDVHSKLGGILFKKGTIILDEHREILDAFGVEQVEIVGEEKKKEKQTKSEKPKTKHETEDPFTELFTQALKTIDHIYKLAQGNAQIPVLEIRKTLQPLLDDSFLQLKHLSRLKFISQNLMKYDSHHALSVGILSYAIGKWLGLEQGEGMQLALAGVLHDIGISRISGHYIYKNGILTKDEFEEVKKHTLYGYQVIKDTKGLTEGTILSVLQHHEREDGSGYPLGLKKDQIHLYAKIVAIADIYHALVSKRNYRAEYPLFQAIEQLSKESFGKLDPKIVRIFIDRMTKISNGTHVLLNSGQEGTIVFVDQHNPTRPWVKVGEEIINLLKEKELYIKDIFL